MINYKTNFEVGGDLRNKTLEVSWIVSFYTVVSYKVGLNMIGALNAQTTTKTLQVTYRSGTKKKKCSLTKNNSAVWK